LSIIETITTGTDAVASSRFSAFKTSQPEKSGSARSRVTATGSMLRARASASSPWRARTGV
jgi:hypothetical protein